MKKRDFLIIGVLLVIGLVSLLVVLLINAGPKDYAYVYLKNTPMISVDFNNAKIEYQVQNQDYPKISDNEEGNKVIILLGDYEIDGNKTEIAIEIDLNNKRIRIAWDHTPQQIGVRRGWYDGTGLPVVSAPNNIYIVFENKAEDVDGVV